MSAEVGRIFPGLLLRHTLRLARQISPMFDYPGHRFPREPLAAKFRRFRNFRRGVSSKLILWPGEVVSRAADEPNHLYHLPTTCPTPGNIDGIKAATT